MSTKQPRPAPTSSSPSQPHHAPKFPKFLQKQGRDRSRSVADAAASTGSSTASSSSSSSNPMPETPKIRKGLKKGLGLKDRDEKQRRQSQDTDSPDRSNEGDDTPADDAPVIIEPVNIPRPRTRSERPLSENSYPQAAFYSSSSTSRLSDLPTRLSGWLSHTFSTSSTDLSLPTLLSQQHLAASTVSPRAKGSALLTAARHGRGHLDKAMRYLLDSDATPDKCTDPIWLLGVEHPGYEPPPPPTASASALNASTGVSRRGSVESRRSPSSRQSSASSSPVISGNNPLSDSSLSQSLPSPSSPNNKDPSRNWPPVFYSDFTSRIWLTYRSQFQPIRDTSLSALESEIGESTATAGTASSPQPKRWNWPLGGEKGWTSDTGWGCMLRTGQSLLANALLHLLLGRDWRRPPHPVFTADYATYVQIITWFLDDPSSLAPFSVHRMALVGKELGKDVGQWFGPSTAAGAIKTLVHAFPEAQLGVSVASDGVIYESDVYAVSKSSMDRCSPRRNGQSSWGDRAVLVLIGIRLGLDGVNPIYYDTIKALYTFPQSVGIAGGRPSSSYYFVGSQADNLFYLDPHHARPAIPLRPPPRHSDNAPVSQDQEYQSSLDASVSSDNERDRAPRRFHHFRSPTTPSSSRSGSGSGGSAFSHRSPPTPSPLQQQVSSSSNTSASQASSQSHTRWQSYSALPDELESESRDSGLGAHLEPIQRHYVTAYSAAELKTFHCDRVRKMPLSGLDPSMLIGFLCKDESDWLDFRRRITELFRTHKQIFSIQDEPPHWPSDSEDSIGLESISEPDIDMPEEFADTASTSESHEASIAKSEADTEDDPIDPLTPGGGKSSIEIPEHAKGEAGEASPEAEESIDFDDEEDEEWMDPAPYPSDTPEAGSTPSSPTTGRVHAPAITESRSTSSTLSTSTTASGKKRKKAKKGTAKGKTTPPPAPVQFPFPAAGSGEDLLQEDLARSNGSKRIPQMRTAKARDGGRTQSGGVRGVPATDIDDDF